MRIQPEGGDALVQHLKAVFALAATDDFTEARDQHIHSADSAFVVIDKHVKRFNIRRPIIHDNGLFKVLFSEVTLVFSLEIATPCGREFPRDLCASENLNRIGVTHTLKAGVDHLLEHGEEAGLNTFVKEEHVGAAPRQGGSDDRLNEFLGKIHVGGEISEGHFGFDHPKFSQVARGIGVFGAEGRAECVDFAQSAGIIFHGELAGDREVRGATEEVFTIVYGAVIGAGWIIYIEGGDLKHFTRAFTIGSSDDGGGDPEEATALEEFMNGHGERVAHAGNSAKGIGARAQMGDRAQVLERHSLLVEWILRWIHETEHTQRSDVKLACLLAAGRGCDDPGDRDTCAGMQVEDVALIILEGGWSNELKIFEARTVVQFDEREATFGVTAGAHPAINNDRGTFKSIVEDACDADAQFTRHTTFSK